MSLTVFVETNGIWCNQPQLKPNPVYSGKENHAKPAGFKLVRNTAKPAPKPTRSGLQRPKEKQSPCPHISLTKILSHKGL
ncbi:hypothetical protein DPMN_154665 [Dreissena polymorpha]|uniref:Uncharacterized protein n=1 Tax=Dreissena polymorpha TaxID=45954 RepID=A0A9D4J5X9_DREPO|nr:hypothetical protein DPMN_154665 [Dreissena polymorpha]